jgi:hypothetical protein
MFIIFFQNTVSLKLRKFTLCKPRSVCKHLKRV